MNIILDRYFTFRTNLVLTFITLHYFRTLPTYQGG